MNEINIGDYILDSSNHFAIGKVFGINKEMGLVQYAEYWEHNEKLQNNIHKCTCLTNVVKFNILTIKLLKHKLDIIDMFLQNEVYNT